MRAISHAQMDSRLCRRITQRNVFVRGSCAMGFVEIPPAVLKGPSVALIGSNQLVRTAGVLVGYGAVQGETMNA